MPETKTSLLLGEILIKQGACTEEDIKKALDIQEKFGGKVGTILLNMGAIKEAQLLSALAYQLNLKFIDTIDEFTPVKEVIDPRLLEINKSVLVKDNSGDYKLLMYDPLNSEMISLISDILGWIPEIAITTEENIRMLLFGDTQDQEENKFVILEDEIEKLRELASEAPVIKLVNSFISKAIESKASDIHFESFKNNMRVRFRIDGVLKTVDIIPNNLKLPVITRLKLISGMNISESRLPQDGRISMRIGGKEIDIRASSLPTRFGESFVLRILEKSSIKFELEKLGFESDHVKRIKDLIYLPNGIFLTTGPTGSGKTTTLYSILNELNRDEVKIITVEDPVEYELPGISQVNVKPEIDLTFANVLRNILRQDPDIILIGEIRDLETAEIAIQASLTGHLVLSTLHTNDALGSIWRLIDMGVPEFLLKNSIIGLMAQRLVRKPCPYCCENTEINHLISLEPNIQEVLDKWRPAKIFPKKVRGCERCNFTGYLGRTVIAEVVPFSKDVLSLVREKKHKEVLNLLNLRSLFEDGLLKAIKGETTIEEVLRVTHEGETH